MAISIRIQRCMFAGDSVKRMKNRQIGKTMPFNLTFNFPPQIFVRKPGQD